MQLCTITWPTPIYRIFRLKPNIKTTSSSVNLALQYISQHVHMYGNTSSISKGKQFEGLQFTNIYNYAPKDF